MSRLIDADLLEPDSDYDDGEYWAYSKTQIDNAPTIKPERKTGKWIDFSMSIKGVPTEACGECGEWSLGIGKNYCPNCGAKMKEETYEQCKRH